MAGVITPQSSTLHQLKHCLLFMRCDCQWKHDKNTISNKKKCCERNNSKSKISINSTTRQHIYTGETISYVEKKEQKLTPSFQTYDYFKQTIIIGFGGVFQWLEDLSPLDFGSIKNQDGAREQLYCSLIQKIREILFPPTVPQKEYRKVFAIPAEEKYVFNLI